MPQCGRCRVTNWPVISEPMPTPKISGSNNKPVSAGPCLVPRADTSAGT